MIFSKQLKFYLVPFLLLIAGVFLGFLLKLPLARFFFAASIVFSLLSVGLIGWRMYKKAPKRSDSYVTWKAFLSVIIGLYMPLIAALLWIVFELGKLAGKVTRGFSSLFY